MTKMTCEDALVRMLDADSGVLLGQGTDELALHLTSCERCATVAATLRGETERLAASLGAPSGIASLAGYRGRRRIRPQIVVPIAIAATMLFIVRDRTTDVPTVAQSASPVAAAMPSESGSHVATVPPQAAVDANPAPVLVRLSPSLATIPVAVQAVQAMAVAPAVSDVQAAAPEVAVDPEPGTRAMIMRGRNPNVTVVWLTK